MFDWLFEEWKTIPGFEDYAVSNRGNVKRITASLGTAVGHIINQNTLRAGYRIVRLYKGKNKWPTPLYVHRLVLIAFTGNPPNGRGQCNHKNGDKLDNRLENLEWVSASENGKHAVYVLGKNRGERIASRGLRNGRAILTENDVFAVRRDLENGVRQIDVAHKYGIAQVTVSAIKRRVIWGWLQ